MIRRSALVLCLALLVAGVACQSMKKVAYDLDPSQRPAEAAYREAIEPYLSKGELYHGPATELLVRALPLVTPVRLAMARRKAAAYDLDQDQLKKELAAARRAGAGELEVIVSAYMPEEQWNNLDSQRPAWMVYLKPSSGPKLHAVDARRIKKRSALNQALYPFWGMWSRLYLLRFPLKPGAGGRYPGADKGVKLIIAGPPGMVEIPLKLP